MFRPWAVFYISKIITHKINLILIIEKFMFDIVSLHVAIFTIFASSLGLPAPKLSVPIRP